MLIFQPIYLFGSIHIDLNCLIIEKLPSLSLISIHLGFIRILQEI